MSSPGAPAFSPSPQSGGSPTPAPRSELAHDLLQAVLQRDGTRARALVAQWREQRGFASLTAFRTTTLAMKAGPAGCDWLVALLEAPASDAPAGDPAAVGVVPASMGLSEPQRQGSALPDSAQPLEVSAAQGPEAGPAVGDAVMPMAAETPASTPSPGVAASESLPTPEILAPSHEAIRLQLDRPAPAPTSWVSSRPAAGSPAISFDLTPSPQPSASVEEPSDEPLPVPFTTSPTAAAVPHQRWSRLAHLWHQGRQRVPRFRRLRRLLADCVSEVQGTFSSQGLEPQEQGEQLELRFMPLPGPEAQGAEPMATEAAAIPPFRVPPAPAIAEALARGTGTSSRPRWGVDGSPAPAPAALADLRAWLPDTSASRPADLPRAC